jgi:periplasmic protein TonB
MEPKKTERANLEKKRGLFLQIGLVAVMGLVLLAFEWKSRPNIDNTLGEQQFEALDEEIIPITRQPETPPPPPPPPPQVISTINIVEDEVDIDDDFDLSDFGMDDDFALSTLTYAEEEGDDEEIFIIVEDMPSFKGEGQEGFRKYIAQNLRYPTIAQENGIQGRVYVQFAVNSKGQVVDVKIARSVDPSLDAEAVRVIKASPPWEPGKQRGQPVKVQFTFPVNFVLQ